MPGPTPSDHPAPSSSPQAQAQQLQQQEQHPQQQELHPQQQQQEQPPQPPPPPQQQQRLLGHELHFWYDTTHLVRTSRLAHIFSTRLCHWLDRTDSALMQQLQLHCKQLPDARASEELLRKKLWNTRLIPR